MGSGKEGKIIWCVIKKPSPFSHLGGNGQEAGLRQKIWGREHFNPSSVLGRGKSIRMPEKIGKG